MEHFYTEQEFEIFLNIKRLFREREDVNNQFYQGFITDEEYSEQMEYIEREIDYYGSM